MRSLAIILLFALFTSACSFSSSNPEAYSDFKPIEVHVYLPDTVTDGGIQTIYAHVSQDGEDIIDAELVRFEVWSSSHEQHEWLATTNEGNGMYAAEVDFTEEGLYFAKRSLKSVIYTQCRLSDLLSAS